MPCRCSLCLLLLILIAFPALAQERTVLRPARVFDGVAMHEDWAVRVEGNRITAAGPAGQVETAGATIIDLPGMTLMPGLIEAHSHLLLHPWGGALGMYDE